MTDTLYREIGRRIRRARENLGISQEDLARRLDYSSPATISHFEAGERRISIVDLQRIAAILGLPTAYFFGGTAERGSSPLSLPGKRGAAECEDICRGFPVIRPEARR